MILHALADDFNLTSFTTEVSGVETIQFTLLSQDQDTLVDQSGDELYIPELGNVSKYPLAALQDDFALNAE